ncbi:MAG: pilus assembly protein TadG-related protein [Rhodospirillaceae bacterium]
MKTSFKRILRDQAGATAVIVGLTLPIVAGMGMLGVDASVWYSERRELQTAVDAAALAGALHKAYGYGVSTVTAIASRDAQRNGFNPGNGTITVNNPPANGPGAGDATAVEVILVENLPMFYARLLGDRVATVTVRATAGTTLDDEFCILGLDPAMASAVNVQGNASVSMSCGIAVNSTSDKALAIAGSVDITASSASISGNMYLNGNPTVNFTEPPRTGQPPVVDPYADLEVPPFGACTATNTTAKNTVTLSPGVYCGGLKANAGANITLDPGVYIMAGGSFDIAGGASLRGDDVTIILTDDAGGNYTTVKINGGADMELNAPASGDWSGILFYQDRNAPSFQGAKIITNTFTGGADMVLNGAVYFPSQAIEYTGNATVASDCLQLIGRQVIMTGNSQLANNCATYGTETLGVARVRLLR